MAEIIRRVQIDFSVHLSETEAIELFEAIAEFPQLLKYPIIGQLISQLPKQVGECSHDQAARANPPTTLEDIKESVEQLDNSYSVYEDPAVVNAISRTLADNNS